MKKLNKVLILLLFAVVFVMPQVSYAENSGVKLLPPIETNSDSLDASVDEAIQNTDTVEEVITPKVEDIKEMTPNANEEIKKEVVTDTNNHLKGVIKKFLMAMAGVIVSSIIIFLLATLFNKFNKFKSGKPEEFFDEPDIPISNDENDALKIFFEKTK